MTRRPWEVALGILADRVVAEPPSQVHPVALFGRVMQSLERVAYRDGRLAGGLYCGLGVAAGVASGALVPSTAVATCVTVGASALWRTASEVERALEADELSAARELLPALVGRDPEGLDEREVARAVVESVAENTVDALVAPATWALAGGSPAVLAYRALNTLDAMVGHRSSRYLRFGWASARLDDLAGWVPARLTAALVAAVRPRSAASVLKVVRTQSRDHPSPNAGVAEGAFAAALGLRLGGSNRYGDRVELRPSLGTGRQACREDISRAVELSRDVSDALVVLLACLGAPTMLHVAGDHLRARRRR